MKKLILPAILVAGAGFAIVKSKKTPPKEEQTYETAERKYLIDFFKGEAGAEVFHIMTDNEINVIYDVIKNYGHINNAPSHLQAEWNAISEKYNIFT